MYTIVLAAGKVDYRNKSQGLSASRHLTLVNGRPAISWVIGDILKQTQDSICLVVNKSDEELLIFYKEHYKNSPRICLSCVETESSIVQSAGSALKMFEKKFDIDAPVRIILGDTYLIGIPYGEGDHVYVTAYDFDSTEWCVATLEENGRISEYINKQPGIRCHPYMALVGRYEFSSGKALVAATYQAVERQHTNLSDILEIYNSHIHLHGLKIPTESWIDFGHLEGLAMARSRLVESRSFNHLVIDPLLPEITKYSSNDAKLECECHWYNRLPEKLHSLTPRVLHKDIGALTMEYYGYGTLAEKFLYIHLHDSFWTGVLNQLFSIVELFKQFPAPMPATNVDGLYIDKTYERLHALQEDVFWHNMLESPDVIINGIHQKGISVLYSYIEDALKSLCHPPILCIFHGDLCFNNILYDVHSGIIKFIDPRGNLEGTPSIYGDPRYDIAKLRHSFCGNYDVIIEGNFFLEQTDEYIYQFDIFKDDQQNRDALFDNLCQRYGYDINEIRFIEALLFLTMIPLHADSRSKQICFFLSAIQKFNSWLERCECASVSI